MESVRNVTGLVYLTLVARPDVILHILGQSRPVELSRHGVNGFGCAQMSAKGGIMVIMQDLRPEIVRLRGVRYADPRVVISWLLPPDMKSPRPE